jgi:cation-transporting ATPase 13A2
MDGSRWTSSSTRSASSPGMAAQANNRLFDRFSLRAAAPCVSSPTTTDDPTIAWHRGTVALQAVAPAGQQALGMVLRTGFGSAKGRLVQSMLHPKDVEVNGIVLSADQCHPRAGLVSLAMTAQSQLMRIVTNVRAQIQSSFEQDTLIFICLMSGMAFGMYIVAMVSLIRHNHSAGDIVLRFLDMITVAVPPALPASMQASFLAVCSMQRCL